MVSASSASTALRKRPGSTTGITGSPGLVRRSRSTRRPCCEPATAGTTRTPRASPCRTGSAWDLLIASNDSGRTPTYALGNPFPNGVQQPPGASLGPLTFLGRDPNFSSPDYIVPTVHQFSVGMQRELPWRISLEASYVGSRTSKLQSEWRGFNEPSAAFQAQCDVTNGGSRSFCDQLLTNPFFNVPGFEGTTRFTSATLSRFELNRPFPSSADARQAATRPATASRCSNATTAACGTTRRSSSRTSGGRKALP